MSTQKSAMEETRQLPQRNGPMGKPRPKSNLHIPSVFEVYGIDHSQHKDSTADNLIFFPLSESNMADTSKLAKEWANT